MDQHFILTLGRSGSNFLVDVINQHPNLTNYGEVLGPWTKFRKAKNLLAPGMSSDRWLDVMIGSPTVFRAVHLARRLNRLGRKGERMKRREEVASAGLKDFSLLMEKEGLEDWLPSRPHVKVITLVRENYLDRAISALMLERTGVHATTAGPAQDRRLDVDPETMLRTMDDIERETDALRAMAAAVDPARRLDLTYEQLFGGTAATDAAVAAVHDHLGVSAAPFRARHGKIVRTPPSETLIRWDDIRAAAAGGPHERWFA